MQSIIPAINALTEKEARRQYGIVIPLVAPGELIHIDVCDGKFVTRITWGTAEEFVKLINSQNHQHTNSNFEVHLMTENPEAVALDWLRTGKVKRVIAHLEALEDSVLFKDRCVQAGATPMLSIAPDTEAERLLAFDGEFSAFQILAVQPGLSGQKFDERCLDKIRLLREKMKRDIIIEVDGGINPETARQCKDAGADQFVSASYITGAENPREAIEKLQAAF